MTYSFKIYYEHFKTGDTRVKYNKYNLLQVNFNNFKNPNDKTINKYYMLDGDILTMDEKEKLLNDIKLKASDEETQESLRLENDIEYRFDLVEEDALKRGIEQGIEQATINTVISMLQNNISIELISKITNKTIEEIKEIIKTHKK